MIGDYATKADEAMYFPPDDDANRPRTEFVARGLCGAPASANQATAGKGTAGQVWITVTQGTQTRWRFLAVRPAASGGTNGSAIELKYVD